MRLASIAALLLSLGCNELTGSSKLRFLACAGEDCARAGGGVSISPQAIDFGEQDCGAQAAPRALRIRNGSEAALKWRASLARAEVSPYELRPAEGVIEPGGAQEVSVVPRAIPIAPGILTQDFSDVVQVDTDSVDAVRAEIKLSQRPRGIVLVAEPDKIRFGNVVLGGAARASITLRNLSTVPAPVGFTSTNPVVSIASESPVVIPAGGSATVEATISPKELGDVLGVINPTTEARICSPLPPISFVGVGIEAAGGRIVAGDAHSCTLALGKVFCWGSNLDGQLGDGAGTSSASPRAVSGLTSAIGLAAGILHSCALDQGGTVSCWGANGLGETGSLSVEPRVRAPAPVFGLRSVISLAAGGSHTCAVDGGRVLCWGSNAAGELGAPLDVGTAQAPVVVQGVGEARSVAAGARHSCAVLAKGSVQCWGDNSRGQLGAVTPGETSGPVQVAGLPNAATEPVVSIAAGALHTCALTSTGRVACWGDNAFGQAASPSSSRVTTPFIVPGLGATKFISAGRLHTCAAGEDKLARCWGSNAGDQLGGDTRPASSASPLQVGGGVSDVVGIAGGTHHTCAIQQRSLVSVVCWGNNAEGQLGDGGYVSSAIPVAVRFP